MPTLRIAPLQNPERDPHLVREPAADAGGCRGRTQAQRRLAREPAGA